MATTTTTTTLTTTATAIPDMSWREVNDMINFAKVLMTLSEAKEVLPTRGLGATSIRTDVTFTKTPMPKGPVDETRPKKGYFWEENQYAVNYTRDKKPRAWVPEIKDAELAADMEAMGICLEGREQRKRKLTEKGQAAVEQAVTKWAKKSKTSK